MPAKWEATTCQTWAEGRGPQEGRGTMEGRWNSRKGNRCSVQGTPAFFFFFYCTNTPPSPSPFLEHKRHPIMGVSFMFWWLPLSKDKKCAQLGMFFMFGTSLSQRHVVHVFCIPTHWNIKNAPQKGVFSMFQWQDIKNMSIWLHFSCLPCPPSLKHQKHIHMDMFLVFSCYLHHSEHWKHAQNGAFLVYSLLPPLKYAWNGTFRCMAFYHQLSFQPFPNENVPFLVHFHDFFGHTYFI